MHRMFCCQLWSSEHKLLDTHRSSLLHMDNKLVISCHIALLGLEFQSKNFGAKSLGALRCHRYGAHAVQLLLMGLQAAWCLATAGD